MPNGGRDDSQYCPQCGQRIWRLTGDKFLKCHRCGWTIGYPILRWIVHPTWILYFIHRLRNYPISTLWNTVKIASVLMVSAALVLHFAGGGTVGDLGSNEADILSLPTATETPEIPVEYSEGQQPESRSEEGLNITRAELLVYQFTNSQREKHGSGQITFSADLAAIARSHSRDMGEHGYIGHEEPDEDTPLDRLQSHPNPCKQYSSSQFAHGENAGGAYWKAEFRSSYSGEELYLDSEQQLAGYLVNAWMNSTGHRRNLLDEEWNHLGVGIAINESGAVHATQLFCQ